jgi:hypothetical protein
MKFEELLENVLSEKTFKDIKHSKNKPVKIKNSELEKDKELAKELFDLINVTYASIGGHLKIQDENDIPGGNENWTAVDVDKDPDADIVFASKTKSGNNKSTVTATDGSVEAKKAMLKLKADELNKPGNNVKIKGR